MCRAVLQDKVNLAAYFAWSFLDTFEWTEGYKARYGIVHVDRTTDRLERHPKLSGLWLSQYFFRCVYTSVASCMATERSTMPSLEEEDGG